MSTNTNHDQEEIDLGQLFGKIGNFFSSIITSIFKGILFVQKNIILLTALIVLGAGLGYYLDSETKVYNHEVVVSPNFGSVDYLYNKINLINSRIKQRDTSFLKSIGIAEPKNIYRISIKPVIDIYSFVNEDRGTTVNNAQNTQNFELVKLLAEDGDINKVIKDSLTSRNYNHHKIVIVTDGFTTNSKSIEPILNYLNQSTFFKQIQKVYIDNLKNKIEKDMITINQIDALLNQFATASSNQKNSNLVYYNENTQLNDVIETKNNLIKNIGLQKTQLVSQNKIVKERSSTLNIQNTKGLNNKMKLVLPIVFIFGFIFLSLFISFYKTQKAKLSNK
jgi:uncharacterized membrane protein YqhA